MHKNMIKGIQIATSLAAISVFSSPLFADRTLATDLHVPTAQQPSDLKKYSKELDNGIKNNSSKEPVGVSCSRGDSSCEE